MVTKAAVKGTHGGARKGAGHPKMPVLEPVTLTVPRGAIVLEPKHSALDAVKRMTRAELVLSLEALAEPALKSLKLWVESGDWEATKWLLEKIDGKPVQRVESPPPQQNNLILNVGDLRQLIALLETRLALPQPVEEDPDAET